MRRGAPQHSESETEEEEEAEEAEAEEEEVADVDDTWRLPRTSCRASEIATSMRERVSPHPPKAYQSRRISTR